MVKIRYHFNAKTLRFEKVRLTLWQKIKRLLVMCSTSIVLAAVVIFFAYLFLDSPKEKKLRRELDNLKFQFSLLNNQIYQLEQVLFDIQQRDNNIYRVIFEAEPIPSSVRRAGFGGIDRYAKLSGFQYSELVISTTRRVDMLASQLYVQSRSFDEVHKMAMNKEALLAALPAIQPISNRDLFRIASHFGYRTDPFYKIKKFHEGIDFTAPVGTEVHATGDGVVVSVERSRVGFGNHIVIDHDFNYQTLYAHLSKFNVRRGEKVRRGQVIGFVGNTGRSTAPHLHYEVHKNGVPVNPIHYFFSDITPEQYDLLIEQSALPGQAMD